MGNPNVKVSVVLLIYKVEKFLPKCIESAINQTYKNIEILLAARSGGDRSMEICREYEKRDERVRVVEVTENGRAPGRNKAMEYAKGEYILFIDGDDWMGSTMVESLIESAIKNDSDAVICGDVYEYDGDDLGKEEKRIANLPAVISRKQMYMEILSRRSFGLEVWNKLYRFSKIRDILFPNITAEDRYWSAEAFERLDKISYVPKAEMHYVIRGDSGSRRPHVAEYSMKADILMVDNILSHDYLQEESSYFLFTSCYNAIYESLYFGYFNYDEWREVYKRIHDLSKTVLKYKIARQQDRLKATVAKMGFHPLVWMIRSSIKVKPAGIFLDEEEQMTF